MRAALKKQNLRKERTKNTKVSTRLEVQEQNVQLPADLSPRKILEDIVRFTARAFYEEEHAILLEALIERVEATDSILAETISLQKKQVNLRLSELKSDLLISNEKFSKKKESHHKFGTNETVWFIDYKNFVDVVKFRLSKMQKLAEERETGDVQYVCTSCGYRYSSYEIPAELVCTACKTGEVREDEAFASQAQAERQLVMQLQKQLEPLIRLIKFTSDLVIPASRTKYATEARTKEQHRQEEDATIRYIQLQDQLGKHNVQNNLPSRTFLGATPNLVVEVATEEQNNIMAPPKKVEKPAPAAPAAAAPSKSDGNVSVQIVSGGEQVEEKTNDLVWLKRSKTDYLSKLNIPSSSSSTFAQKAASMQTAPLESPITPSPAPINDEDMRDYFIDTSHQQTEQSEESMYEEAPAVAAVDQDQIVYVNGSPKKLSEVTEEDQLLMTQEEYLAYFNAQNS